MVFFPSKEQPCYRVMRSAAMCMNSSGDVKAYSYGPRNFNASVCATLLISTTYTTINLPLQLHYQHHLCSAEIPPTWSLAGKLRKSVPEPHLRLREISGGAVNDLRNGPSRTTPDLQEDLSYGHLLSYVSCSRARGSFDNEILTRCCQVERPPTAV